MVSVDERSVRIDREAPVGVAVMRDAGVGTVLAHGVDEVVHVRAAAVLVDVQPVGLGVDRDDRGAGGPVHLRRQRRRGTVRAVDDDGQPVEGVRERGQQVVLVQSDRLCVVLHAADGGTDRAIPRLAQASLDGVLDDVVELDPAAREELDAVVGHRVVGGGQHDAEIGAEGLGQERDAGSRQDPHQDDVDAGTREAGHDRSLEELAAGPGIPAHDGLRAMPGEGTRVTEDMRGSDREVQGQLSREITVRQAPDPVGAEESRQVTSACCTGVPYGPSSGRTSCAPWPAGRG